MKLTSKYIRSLLEYDASTGIFIWKKRDEVTHFIKTWNTKYAGKIAGVKDNYGYVIITVGHKPYKAHRLAWLYVAGEWPEKEIDHKDLCHSNNRWDNLREATNGQNKFNRKKLSINTSGYKGVHLTDRGTWRAAITMNHKTVNLGDYATPEEAYKAYCAACEYRGEFGRVA